MDGLFSHVALSRLQFAFTAMFHILWPVLTIGLSLYLVLMEALWLKTGDEIYYRQARFWARLFIVNFAVGMVTGIPMEFQFGTNWSTFSTAGGDIFGHLLGFEDNGGKDEKRNTDISGSHPGRPFSRQSAGG